MQTKPMTTVLIVDADDVASRRIGDVLEGRGYRVWYARSGSEAETMAEDLHPDLFLLEVILPDVDGLLLCASLKKRFKQPTILCSSTRRRRDSVLGLKLGADDFINKPVELYDFEARIEAVLRRTARQRALDPQPPAPEFYRVDDLVVDGGRHRVTYGGRQVPVTPTEYRLLAALASNPGKVFTRSELAELVWGHPDASSGRTIDVHIRRLRVKLDPITNGYPLITSVRGFGYKIASRARPADGPRSVDQITVSVA